MSNACSSTSSKERTVPWVSPDNPDVRGFRLTSTYLSLRKRVELAVFVSVRRVRQKGFEPSSRGAPPAWTAGNDSGGGKPPSGRLESEDRAAGVPAEALEPSPGT